MKLITKYIWCEIKKYYNVLRDLKRIPVGYGKVALC